MPRRNRKQTFFNIEVIDAGAKGKSVAKAPDGKIIFLDNAVPGDIVDIQTFKKEKDITKEKLLSFTNYQNLGKTLFVNTLDSVVVANGSI